MPPCHNLCHASNVLSSVPLMAAKNIEDGNCLDLCGAIPIGKSCSSQQLAPSGNPQMKFIIWPWSVGKLASQTGGYGLTYKPPVVYCQRISGAGWLSGVSPVAPVGRVDAIKSSDPFGCD